MIVTRLPSPDSRLAVAADVRPTASTRLGSAGASQSIAALGNAAELR